MKTTVMKRTFYLFACSVLILASCGGKKKPQPPVNNHPPVNNTTTFAAAPVFNADSAYAFVEKQLSFGPRVPNSEGHKKCGDYLISQLKTYGAEVIVQEAKVMAYTGASLRIRNIIARYNPEKTNRVVLFAHWDTRPFSDMDPVNDKDPVPGADDGASGVAVLLEIARNIQTTQPQVGIDLIFLDGEDYGNAGGEPETYCLGTQYWAKNPPIPGYMPKYGILLDMVGARGAMFCKEAYSRQYASSVVENIWNTAAQLGYANYFISKDSDPLTDDHVFINTLAKIPTADIINYNRDTGGFGSHWHTQDDNISIIDKNTLKAVGQTVTQVIYNEQ